MNKRMGVCTLLLSRSKDLLGEGRQRDSINIKSSLRRHPPEEAVGKYPNKQTFWSLNMCRLQDKQARGERGQWLEAGGWIAIYGLFNQWASTVCAELTMGFLSFATCHGNNYFGHGNCKYNFLKWYGGNMHRSHTRVCVYSLRQSQLCDHWQK